MKNTKKTRVMGISMDINDALFRHLNAAKIAKEYRESKEGKILKGFMMELNYIAEELLLHHDVTCIFCSEQEDKHFEFQCRFHEECVISSYHTGVYAYLGMEQVEEFVTFKASFELQTFIHENKSCPIANKFEREIDFILEYCIDNFSQNIYVVEYNEAPQESSIVLQEENDEQLENEERKHPPSPPMDEGNTQDFADDKLCFYDSKNDEEHGLDMPGLLDTLLDTYRGSTSSEYEI